MAKYTREEELAILQAAQEARERGDLEEASRLSKKLPLLPCLAMSLKEQVGAEELLKQGYDLSEAEKAYGKNWLAV